MKVKLKRGYEIEFREENRCLTEDIDELGSYARGGYGQCKIVGKYGIAPTVTENHGEVTAIIEEE
jgi:hypothetical protein